MRILDLIVSVIITIISTSCSKKVVNVPLDERFTTRVAFLNLAKITPYNIQTLIPELLPSLKKYSNPNDIMHWSLKASDQADIGILSLETIFYGSLIASRISNDTYQEISDRIDQFITFKKTKPLWKLYCSSVVMRIPHYNGDFQQPWYWGQYGQLLYTLSYYCDKYNKTQDPSALQICNNTAAQVPLKIIQQFKWRRSRNHNITLKLLNALNNYRALFSRLYITLDDSAEFGLNAQQANQIIGLVNKYNLSNIVRVYPGADQVSLTLLSAAAVDDSNETLPTVAMIFRNSSNVQAIPNYQGLPMIQTLQNQIRAAGGQPINGTQLKRGNVTLLINNFDEPKQMEAPSQGPANQKNYTLFDNYICSNGTQVIGLADNRYSNGADVYFVNYALAKVKQCRNLTQWAYAGWNTNGNTLGTVISNSILLWIYRNSKFRSSHVSKQVSDYVSPCQSGDVKCANSYFNTLRILQDKDWQVILRQMTRNYIYQTPGDNINDLSNDLPFYSQFVFKSMAAKQKQLKNMLGLGFELSEVYFPWNRTFQIGLVGVIKSSSTSLPVMQFD